MIRNLVFPACLLACLLQMTACQPKTAEQEAPPEPEPGFTYDLIVEKETLRLRAEAGPEGTVLQTLTRGARLKDLEQVSDFTSQIQLDGEFYNEPWIRVETEAGDKGWVYARAKDFSLPGEGSMADWHYHKRLLAYFGPERTEALAAYRSAFQQVRSLTDFVTVYERGRNLREELVITLEDQTARIEIEKQPDLFWLSEVMPGFVPQLVAEGTAYYLFADYEQWLGKARQTREEADDSFVQLCISIFPQDSIEYFFPVWQIQTWDYGGHSLLGRGHHLATLRTIDRLSRQAPAFEPYLREWKQDLINDITAVETTYWEEQTRALEELNQIVSAGFAYLNRDDKVALETRKQQFENAGQYGIKFNYKSGEY